jgi:peptidoglycan-N-acetylglucosamine deacetylase
VTLNRVSFWLVPVASVVFTVLGSVTMVSAAPSSAGRAKLQSAVRGHLGGRSQHALVNSTSAGESSGAEKYRPTMSLMQRDEYERQRGYRFSKIVRGNRSLKTIALTFDDGPHEGYTQQLLAILKRNNVRATFFVIGKQVDKFPDLVQMEVAAGHEIGNHTYDHVDLTQIPPELIGYELDECDSAIRRASGYTSRFFRPPGGNYDLNVIKEATRRSYTTTLWTDDPGDYAKPGAEIVLRRTISGLESGAIVLLHDGIPETMDILPDLIKEARRRGYQFVTISELAKER